MKSRTWMLMAAVCLFTTLAMTVQLSAQDNHQQKRKHLRYKVIDVGTLGGPTSGFSEDSRIINRSGAAVGSSDTLVFDPYCGCNAIHGFLWEEGVMTDLGPLPGGGVETGAFAINSHGTVVGVSNNGLFDPVFGPDSDTTTWKDGQITDLGTLGGSFSIPNDINSRGQIAGGATNTVPDPDGLGGLLLGLGSSTQWRAALWQNGTVQDLGTLGTGPDAVSFFVNELGQVAGYSYTNSVVNPETGIPTVDPFFWEDGQMVDVGTLGGVYGQAVGLNNRGQVAGFSDLVGDLTHHPFSWLQGVLTDLGTLGGDNGQANWLNDAGEVVGKADLPGSQLHDAFLWKRGVMKDLGTVVGDPCSNAFSINSKGQVVGNSSDCVTPRHAFLWESGGPMIDLNEFVPPDTGLTLTFATFINDRGEIAVQGVLPNGDTRAVLLIPCKQHGKNGCQNDSESLTAGTRNSVPPGLTAPTAMRSGTGASVRARSMRNRWTRGGGA